jgi:tRNA pseudouridine55 synthase
LNTDGLVLIDKASGMTSHDVVATFRRASRIKKAGHTGTLDPMATGLLVICSGKSTRLQSYFTGMEKTYEGEIQFGFATNTYDAEGEALGEAVAADVTHVDFAAAVQPFTGAIQQIPPAFSAKKIDGKRAYAMARAGEEVKLEPRSVTVYEFAITAVNGSVATFRARVSAGTYVRSLAHDLGASIGVAAHLNSLRRTAIGSMKVEDAIEVGRLREMELEAIFAKPHFKKLGEIDLAMPRVLIDGLQEKKILQGQSVITKPDVELERGATVSLISLQSDELIALATVANVLREDGPVELAPKVVL